MTDARRSPRSDARELEPMPFSDRHTYMNAEHGSRALLNHCLRSDSFPAEQPERPALSFDQQLERVRNGARIVEVVPIRKAEPERTLGGVTDWGGF